MDRGEVNSNPLLSIEQTDTAESPQSLHATLISQFLVAQVQLNRHSEYTVCTCVDSSKGQVFTTVGGSVEWT